MSRLILPLVLASGLMVGFSLHAVDADKTVKVKDDKVLVPKTEEVKTDDAVKVDDVKKDEAVKTDEEVVPKPADVDEDVMKKDDVIKEDGVMKKQELREGLRDKVMQKDFRDTDSKAMFYCQ